MAVFSVIPQGDPDLTAKLNELFKTNTPEQQNNTFWFPTLKILESLKITPIQIRNLKETSELKEKEKPNPQENKKSRN